MTSCIRFLCIFVWLMVSKSRTLAYRSGCSGGNCFVLSDISNSNELLSQSNAQQRCRSNGTRLVEISNKDIQNSLISFITSVYSQGLNGSSVLTNGKRSSGNWVRNNGNGIGGITVYEQTDSSYAYGYLRPTTSGLDLFASRTTHVKGFICTGLIDCSGGVTISGQCHKSFSETLSWYDARNRCLDRGGDLASFDHITTNAGFNALNGSWLNASNSYWIGLRREWWTWQSSNSDVKYTEWLSGHPRNHIDCLCLSTTQWKWIECNCTHQLPFVCVLETSTTSSKSTTTSTTTTSTSRSPTFTSKSTPDANDTESMERSKGLKTGLAVGLGIGIPVVIIIAGLVIIVAVHRKRQRQALPSLESNQTATSKKTIQEPVSRDIRGLSDVIEDPYEVLQTKKEGMAGYAYLYPSLEY